MTPRWFYKWQSPSQTLVGRLAKPLVSTMRTRNAWWTHGAILFLESLDQRLRCIHGTGGRAKERQPYAGWHEAVDSSQRYGRTATMFYLTSAGL